MFKIKCLLERRNIFEYLMLKIVVHNFFNVNGDSSLDGPIQFGDEEKAKGRYCRFIRSHDQMHLKGSNLIQLNTFLAFLDITLLIVDLLLICIWKEIP